MRDRFSTWPSLTVEFVLLPWHWRVWFWRDWDCTSSCSLTVGPVKVEWFANRPMFRDPPLVPPPAVNPEPIWLVDPVTGALVPNDPPPPPPI